MGSTPPSFEEWAPGNVEVLRTTSSLPNVVQETARTVPMDANKATFGARPRPVTTCASNLVFESRPRSIWDLRAFTKASLQLDGLSRSRCFVNRHHYFQIAQPFFTWSQRLLVPHDASGQVVHLRGKVIDGG